MILSEEEYNCALNAFLKKTGCIGQNDSVAFKWLTVSSTDISTMLTVWLFAYALDSYVHNESAENYITESQAIAMLDKSYTF